MQYADFESTFNSFDTDGDGALNESEVYYFFLYYGYDFSDEQIDLLFEIGDVDDSGELDYDEVYNVYTLVLGIDAAVENGATATTEYTAA